MAVFPGPGDPDEALHQMAARAPQLRPPQRAILQELALEWEEIGKSVNPIDRENATLAARATYMAAGLPAPRIEFVDSPMAALERAKQVVAERLGGEGLGDNRRARAHLAQEIATANIWSQVIEEPRERAQREIVPQLGAAGIRVHLELERPLFDSVFDKIGNQVWRELMEMDKDWADKMFRGQHDANWLAFINFAQRAQNIPAPYLGGMIALGREAGWCVMLRDAIVISERPLEINLDDEGKLHDEVGPAMTFRDGRGIYSWHGSRVPSKVILAPHTLTAQDVLGERNAEVRRIMIERMDAKVFLDGVNAQKVHENEHGVLWSVDLEDGGDGVKIVEVINSTPEPDGILKHYFLFVPPNMQDATEAIAWTFDVERREYHPEAET